MRLAILNLTGGGMCGGYRKYLKNVIPRFAQHRVIESLLCAAPASLRIQEWFGLIKNVKFVNCQPFKPLFQYDKKLMKYLDDFCPDVLFVPMERYYKYKSVPLVNMIQNMLPFVSIKNNTFCERLRNYVQKIIAQDAVMRSDRVIATSYHVKNYLTGELNSSEERIGLVYFGVDAVSNNEGDRPVSIPANWGSDFLFTCGSIDPYRGLEDIVFALKALSSYGKDVKLIIAGETRDSMAGYKKKIERLINKYGLSNKIYWAGRLDSQQMSWCYQNCRVLIVSSRVEAIPNIALEAMAHGCVIVAANNPPFPELFRNSALYYELSKEVSLAKKVQEVLNWDSEKRKEAQEIAKSEAKRFNWDMSVDKTVNELIKAMRERK